MWPWSFSSRRKSFPAFAFSPGDRAVSYRVSEILAEDAADTLLTIRLVLVVPPLRRAMCWQTQRPLSAVVFALVGMAVLVVGLFVTVADEVCGDSTTSFCVAVGASG